MLPNMSQVLTRFERQVTIKTVSITTVDFVETETVAGRTQRCVVQVQEQEALKSDTIDWTKEYLMVHSKGSIAVGELIEFDGKDFKVIKRGPWRGYGYTEVVAEETKEPVKVVNV